MIQTAQAPAPRRPYLDGGTACTKTRAAENASCRFTLPPESVGGAAGRLVRGARRPAAVRYSFSMLRALLVAAIALGAAARCYLLVERPLWADEIFTLNVAQRDFAGIVEALRVDSGPPLHYVLARLALLPFAHPGPFDVLVRVPSVVASLLHLPLLVLVARRLGRPGAGLPAAALYALFPLAVTYAAEGRAYAVASLLVLAAFERALALREAPTAGRAAGLALAAGAALLCHYLTVFPLVGLLALLPSVDAPARTRILLGLAGGAILFLPWLPVALGQPHASMAWAREPRFAQAPLHFPVNLVFGIVPGRSLGVLFALAILILGLALFFAGRGTLRLPAAVLVTGALLLAATHFLAGPLLLPERSAVLFLPFVALLLAGGPVPLPVLSAGVSLAGLVLLVRQAAAPLVSDQIAALLEKEMRPGRKVCVAALWGPDLDYRLARAGYPGSVVLFPSDVARHPGWFHEDQVDAARLAAEARQLVAPPSRPTLFLLPKGSRTAAALLAELAPYGARRRAANAFVELVELPDAAPPRAVTGHP